LVLTASDKAVVTVFIDDEGGEIKGVVIEAKLRLYFYEPSHQHLPHAYIYIGVPRHKVAGNIGLLLPIACMVFDLFDIGVHLG
jgi:hypothetical protein